MPNSLRPARIAALFAAMMLCATASLVSAQNFDTVQVTSTRLAENVHMLVGSGGNIGLMVGTDAVFVVDDQFAPLTPKILAAIKAITPQPVRFVVNTHWHFDHTGGNENMGQAGAPSSRTRTCGSAYRPSIIEALKLKQPAALRGALPVVTSPIRVVPPDGDSVVIFVAPAHTDGDAVVRFTKANVVHTGDLFVSDRSRSPTDRAARSRDHAAAGACSRYRTPRRIIPGHGPLADRARLQAYHDMLVVTRDRMRKEVAASTRSTVLASKITAEYDKEWPNGRAILRILFRSSPLAEPTHG
jgi:glyoxylase-like metal-dependent hydrolase (beta-lactamase superfamily II)